MTFSPNTLFHYGETFHLGAGAGRTGGLLQENFTKDG